MSLWSNTATNAAKPKFLLAGDKHYNNANCYSVNNSQEEVANSANQIYQPGHSGWVEVLPVYTDTCGNQRHKCETLVVMSTPITGNLVVGLTGYFNYANGGNTLVGTANSRVNFELKVGDVIIVGGGANTTSKVISLVNANAVIVNTTFASNGTNQNVWATDLAWFPKS